jgi:uncharacterized membrane protein YgdD (TMEM256/DUF423 family)
MHKPFLTAGAIFGALAIALGAFGAHGLERVTSDPKILHSFQTGVQYQMYHALALLVVGILVEKFPGKWLQWAGSAFTIGILLFSGSLYLLTFLKTQGSSTRIVGPITPLGGIVFIIGWVCLLIAVTRRNSKS